MSSDAKSILGTIAANIIGVLRLSLCRPVHEDTRPTLISRPYVTDYKHLVLRYNLKPAGSAECGYAWWSCSGPCTHSPQIGLQDGIAGPGKVEEECSLSLLHQWRKIQRKVGLWSGRRVRMGPRMTECKSRISLIVLIQQIFMRLSSHEWKRHWLSTKTPRESLTALVIKQFVPALSTAVAVAVSEEMKGVMGTMASHGHRTSARSTATENRLLAAVTSLTYENDRLQQYSCRESVRIFGIRQAEQVEQKALKAGADVKEEDSRLSTGSARSGGGRGPSWWICLPREESWDNGEEVSRFHWAFCPWRGRMANRRSTSTTTSLLCGPNCWLW